jgi:zinc transport system substrate-binding protein
MGRKRIVCIEMSAFKTIFAFFSLLLCLSCSKDDPQGPSRKPLLLVSIAPYQFLAERIAGPDFEVKSIAPSNANPHAFEPTSSQVAEMTRAAAWFRIGEPFEEKILPYLSQIRTIYDLRTGISLLGGSPSCHECSKDHFDRHIWMSPKLTGQQAAAIATVLSERFPDQKTQFEKNLTVLQGQLSMLDIEIQTLLNPVQDRTLLVSLPAFAYFCKDYGFEQLSVEFEGKDPRPKHLEDLLKRALSEHTEIALALPQYNNKGTQLIAEKLSLDLHEIDPYSPDYFQTMRKLARLIAAPRKTNE